MCVTNPFGVNEVDENGVGSVSLVLLHHAERMGTSVKARGLKRRG